MKFLKLLTNTLLALFLLAAALPEKAAQAAQIPGENKDNFRQCLSYEPEVSSLGGQLTRKTVVNASNRKENIWVLKLDEPACVEADEENEMNVRIERVTEVQLVLQAEQFKKYRANLNKKIVAHGTLFGGHTQHHFTDVLMIVEEIKAR